MEGRKEGRQEECTQEADRRELRLTRDLMAADTHFKQFSAPDFTEDAHFPSLPPLTSSQDPAVNSGGAASSKPQQRRNTTEGLPELTGQEPQVNPLTVR